jgi:hydroxyacylglutathione hydrolase
MQPLHVVALPAITDDDIWMLHDGMQAVVADRGNATPVHHALDGRDLDVRLILVTHHLGDCGRRVHAMRGPEHGWTPEALPLPFDHRARRCGAPSDDPARVFASPRA